MQNVQTNPHKNVQTHRQGLRYEAEDDSRLARFVVSRARGNATMGVWLHWYLYTEWEDPAFGPRAGCVCTAVDNVSTPRTTLDRVAALVPVHGVGVQGPRGWPPGRVVPFTSELIPTWLCKAF